MPAAGDYHVVVFEREPAPELRAIYDATAPRVEYAALVAHGDPAPAPVDAAGFRRARARIPEFAPVRVRLGYERGLREGAELLAASWRDLALAVVVADAPPFDARLALRRDVPRGAIAVARSRGRSRSP